MRILLVEDDPLLGRAARMALEQKQYVVDLVATLAEARSFVSTMGYDAILLDLGLPDGEGSSLIRDLRQQENPIPIIVLTARDDIPQRIKALDTGADDYLVKPYDILEVEARLRAVRRRLAGSANDQLIHGAITVFPGSRQVLLEGEPVSLTAKEYAVLLLLLENRGMVFSRQQIEDTLYQYGYEINSNTVEVHIHHLRKKLGRQLIRTLHAAGYCIDLPAKA